VGPSPAFLGSLSQSLFTSDEIVSQRSATKTSKSASRTQTVKATAVH
jgi:hypothetical protein